VANVIKETKGLWFGVDSINEALSLRKAGMTNPILVLGYVPLDRLAEAAQYDLRLTVYNPETIDALGKLRTSNIKLPTSIKLHVKVETGTYRQGVLPEDLSDFFARIKKYPNLEVEGVSSHFANIEDTTDHSYAERQLDAYKRIVGRLKGPPAGEAGEGVSPKIHHMAASAATILFPETHFDMVRVGISLYGLWPSRETLVSAKEKKVKLELKPVLSWKTRIAQIKKVKAGESVGYGLTERVSSDSLIAILPVGYYDGFDRKLSSVGNVLIGGKRCKLLGRVFMNMITVDVTHVPAVKIEDEAVLIGDQESERVSAEDLAGKIGTINFEVVARINPLLPRIIV
jgi:alanine racemase